MVTVRLFAAAREALGAAEVEVPHGPVRDVCSRIEGSVEAQRRPRVAAVLAMSTLLCDGVRHRAADDAMLPAGSVLDVLPPFAGG